MNILSLRKNYMCVSRAATGLYLIFQQENICNKKVLYPANICYAAIYPSVYTNNLPVFCDVDYFTGNVTYDVVKKYIDKVDVMVLPRMYGNPISADE